MSQMNKKRGLEMDEKKININLRPAAELNIEIQKKQSLSIALNGNSIPGTRNYNNLTNKPSINGVTLSGDKTIVDLGIVSENTEAGWSGTPLYVPKRGEVCVYTDTARIKVGDGVVPVVDLPYIGLADTQAVLNVLQNHISNQTIHVTQEDRDRWDAKLNYAAIGETLIFNRL